MMRPTLLATFLLLSSIYPTRAAVPSDGTSPYDATPSSSSSASSPSGSDAAVADSVAAMFAGTPNSRRNVEVLPWSKRQLNSETLDDAEAAKADLKAEVWDAQPAPLRQTSRTEILSRSEARKARRAERRAKLEMERGLTERQTVARRSYAVLTGRVYTGLGINIVALGSIANQTLAQCGAACDRTRDCNQFDLAGATQRPPRTCYLFNAIVDGSQSQTDYQSAVLGTCAQYGIAPSSCTTQSL